MRKRERGLTSEKKVDALTADFRTLELTIQSSIEIVKEERAILENMRIDEFDRRVAFRLAQEQAQFLRNIRESLTPLNRRRGRIRATEKESRKMLSLTTSILSHRSEVALILTWLDEQEEIAKNDPVIVFS